MTNNEERRAPIYLDGEKSIYEISIDSIVYNTKTEKALTPSISSSGYFRVNLWHNNKVHQKMLHRLFAEAFVPNPDPKIYKIVKILDGDPTNIRVNNLLWVKKAYF